MGAPDPIRGERVVAYVALKEEIATEAEIVEFCRKHLAPFRPGLPKSATGKDTSAGFKGRVRLAFLNFWGIIGRWVRVMRRIRLSVIILAIAALVVGLLAMRSYIRSVEERSKLLAPMGQIHREEVEAGRKAPTTKIRAKDKQEEIYSVPQPIKLGE